MSVESKPYLSDSYCHRILRYKDICINTPTSVPKVPKTKKIDKEIKQSINSRPFLRNSRATSLRFSIVNI